MRAAPRGPKLRESARLLRAFRYEQSDPDRFYRLLASDTAAVLSRYTPVTGRRLVEVGSGPGDLTEALREAGAQVVGVDPSWDEMHCRQRSLRDMVLADGYQLPFFDSCFDGGCSSNVLEHVAEPISIVKELIRVVRPGGVVFVNYTVWLSPFGGHETAPWHWLGGQRALERYTRRHGRPPKNRYGESLFALGVGPVLDALSSLPGAKMVDAFPRYFPLWTRPVLKVPGLREVATLNLAVVLRCT